jgi:hypothetical protein
MSREAKMIIGIGVRIAQNILRTFIKSNLVDRTLTYVTSASQKKPMMVAQHKDLNQRLTSFQRALVSLKIA